MEAIDEVLREFLNESYKNLDLMARDLSALESRPIQTEPSIRLCRILHTFKGTSGMLGFSHLQKTSRAAETLLEKVRDGHLPFQPKHAEVLRRLLDALEDTLESIQRDQSDEGPKLGPLAADLATMVSEKPTALKK
jgi:two-component system chemotaxis sensor kinase CheA